MRHGVVPMQDIEEMIREQYIMGAHAKNIQPSALDLQLENEFYRIEDVFIPQKDKSIRYMIERVGAMRYDPSYPLERNIHYLVKLKESLKLPPYIYGSCNPKSTTGRNDVHSRIVADGVARYDVIPYGFSGELWNLISPQSFPIRITPGTSLSQLRFFTGSVRLDEAELRLLCASEKLIWSSNGRAFNYDELKISDNDGTIILTADITHTVVGWECLGSNKILDFSANNEVPVSFFRPIHNENGKIHLRKGCFYVLHTKERVRVPPSLACVMLPVDTSSGEFRAHYAGFIDPGWGYGKDGQGIGRKLVLEVRPFTDLVVYDNQPIAKIAFEKMSTTPPLFYDEFIGAHYTVEPDIPMLAKQFLSS